jgi:hypothetical protein
MGGGALQAEVTYLKQLMFMNALANAQNPTMLQALATQNPLMAGVVVASCAPNPNPNPLAFCLGPSNA